MSSSTQASSASPAVWDWRHFLLSHLAWVILAAASVVGFRSWVQEHDARVAAEQVVKDASAQVASLRGQIADRDKASAAQQAPIIKVIHDVRTVQQAAAALPQVLAQPLPAPVVVNRPDNSVTVPEPDILPLFDQVADDKVCRLEVSRLGGDLADERTASKKKDDEIAALKKPRGFWSRVKGTVKDVGIGIGIGLVLGRKLP